jgi:hypothetical protein
MKTEEKLIQAEELLNAGVALAHEGVVELITNNVVLDSKNKNLEIRIIELEAKEITQPSLDSSEIAIVFDPKTENKGWGDSYYYKTDEDSILTDEVIICGGRSGVINAKKEEFRVDWDNVTFIQGPYPTGWGASIGKVVGSIRNCTFSKLGETKMSASDSPKDGHPIYAKPGGDLLYEGNKFLDCGGNTQLACRPWEQVMPSKVRITMRNNFWSNCSWNPTGHGGGGSFNIAAYCNTEEGTEVVIEDNIIHNTVAYPGTSLTQHEPSARGVLAIWNEAWYAPKKAIDKGFSPDSKYFFKSLKFNNNIIRTTQTDRSPIQIKGCKDIEIKNLAVHYIGEVNMDKHFMKIDTDPDNPVKATKIRIDPIDSDGTIQFKETVIQLRQGLTWDA